MGRKKYIPTSEYSLSVPTRPEEMVLRTHNRFAKESLRHTLETHHAENLPNHFKRDAHTRYAHFDRHPKYIRWKQKTYGTGGLDLVKTGESRRLMLLKPATIRMSGAAEGGKKDLSGKLLLRFSFKGGSGRFRKQGTRQERVIRAMHEEIRRITPREGAELANAFGKKYFEFVGSMPKRQRKRKVTI